MTSQRFALQVTAIIVKAAQRLGRRAEKQARPGAQLILEDDEADDLQGGALVIWAGPDIKPGTRPRP